MNFPIRSDRRVVSVLDKRAVCASINSIARILVLLIQEFAKIKKPDGNHCESIVSCFSIEKQS